jgi:hypothetical protein
VMRLRGGNRSCAGVRGGGGSSDRTGIRRIFPANYPITGSTRCCAPAPIEKTVALPSPVMKSRRRISDAPCQQPIAIR